MYTTARGLALVAGVVSAETGHAPPPQPTNVPSAYARRTVRYAQPGPYGPLAADPYHQQQQSYGVHHHHSQGYQPVGYRPTQQQRHTGSYVPTQQHYNAWGQDRVESQVDKTNWWSPYQQYRPPVIAYKAAHLNKHHFAICEEIQLADSASPFPGGSIKFAQIPGHAVQVRGEFTGSLNPGPAGSGGEISMIFRETGITYGDPAANEPLNADPTQVKQCGAAFSGKEFNPMRAIDKYGNAFTHQDPARGRLDVRSQENIVVGDDSIQRWTQDHLYQNLVGKDSIVGRSIIFFRGVDETIFDDSTNFDTRQSCCQIAIDEKPEAKMQTNVPHHGYPYSNPQPQHRHNVSTQYQAPTAVHAATTHQTYSAPTQGQGYSYQPTAHTGHY